MTFERACNQTLLRYRITSAQLELLRFVRERAEAGEIVNQRRIETALGVKNPTVTGLLNRLEAKGFIRRVPDRTDARARLIYLTELEAKMRDDFISTAQASETRLTAGFTAQEIEALSALLNKILRNIDNETGEENRLW